MAFSGLPLSDGINSALCQRNKNNDEDNAFLLSSKMAPSGFYVK